MVGERPSGARKSPSPLVLLAAAVLGLCMAAALWTIFAVKRDDSSHGVAELALVREDPTPARPSSSRSTPRANLEGEQVPDSGLLQAIADEGANRPAVDVRAKPTGDLVAQLLSTNDPWFKADVIAELVSRHARSGVVAISASLTDQDGDVRRLAADALAELGDPSTVPSLTRALSLEHTERGRAAIMEAINELRER